MKSETALEESLKNLDMLLQQVTLNPDQYVKNNTIRAALVSQGALAKYTQTIEPVILATSINTLKKYADAVLDKGFAELDEKRRAAAAEIERHNARANKPAKVTRESLRDNIKELEEEVNIILGDLWNLSKAFHRAMRNARHYANQSKNLTLIAQCELDEVELREMVSFVKKKALIAAEEKLS